MNGKKTLTYAVFFPSKTKRTQEYRRVLKDSKKADMDLIPYRLFFIALSLSVVNKCALPDSF